MHVQSNRRIDAMPCLAMKILWSTAVCNAMPCFALPLRRGPFSVFFFFFYRIMIRQGTALRCKQEQLYTANKKKKEHIIFSQNHSAYPWRSWRFFALIIVWLVHQPQYPMRTEYTPYSSVYMVQWCIMYPRWCTMPIFTRWDRGNRWVVVSSVAFLVCNERWFSYLYFLSRLLARLDSILVLCNGVLSCVDACCRV